MILVHREDEEAVEVEAEEDAVSKQLFLFLLNAFFQNSTRGCKNTKKIKIAVATNGKEKLEDAVSQVFGRAATFTIVDIEGKDIQEVKVIENPAASYEHGVGPLVVKKLIDSKVNVVIAPEFGPGASTLLESHKIVMISVESGIKVRKAVKDALKMLESG